LAYATSASDLRLRMEGLSTTVEKEKLGIDDGSKEFKTEDYIALKE
jgi:hypothetical protein